MQNTVSIKENRLFRACYGHGKSAARKTMAVYVLKSRQKTINQLGITVSVKLGSAVVRNRFRRRLREAYRLSESRIKPGHNIVIVARHGGIDAPFALLQKDLDLLLGKLGLLEQQHDA